MIFFFPFVLEIAGGGRTFFPSPGAVQTENLVRITAGGDNFFAVKIHVGGGEGAVGGGKNPGKFGRA